MKKEFENEKRDIERSDLNARILEVLKRGKTGENRSLKNEF